MLFTSCTIFLHTQSTTTRTISLRRGRHGHPLQNIFLDCHTKALLALQGFIDSGKKFQFRPGDIVNDLLWIEDLWCGIDNINKLKIWKVFYFSIFEVEKFVFSHLFTRTIFMLLLTTALRSVDILMVLQM